MVFNFQDQHKLVEEMLHMFLQQPFHLSREAFEFVTLKGTIIAVSIQTGYTYGSQPAFLTEDVKQFESVEILCRNPAFPLNITNGIVQYSNKDVQPLEFVSIKTLAQLIVFAINNS